MRIRHKGLRALAEQDRANQVPAELAPRLRSIRASGNWRVVFRFEDSEAVDVDLVDYH